MFLSYFISYNTRSIVHNTLFRPESLVRVEEFALIGGLWSIFIMIACTRAHIYYQVANEDINNYSNMICSQFIISYSRMHNLNSTAAL